MGPSSIPTDWLLREIDVDLLHIEILVDAPLAELAAESRLLVAAPRRLDVGRLHVVDPHDAGAQALDHPQRAEDVARPDRRRQAEVGVVRDPQRVLLAVERDDRRDRTEDLLAR